MKTGVKIELRRSSGTGKLLTKVPLQVAKEKPTGKRLCQTKAQLTIRIGE